MGDRSYNLKVITPNDKPDVIDFLSRFFFIDEPLNVETGIHTDYLNGKRCPELEDYCTNSIPELNSISAISSTGQMVGVSLNGEINRFGKKEESECPNEKFKKVLVLLMAAEKETQVFDRYPGVNKILDIKIVSVDSKWRGMGICKAMIEYGRKVAKEQNFEMLKIDCTSEFSARVVKRLGFERIHLLKYSDYFEEGTNKPVFNPPSPHYGVQVCIYKLN